MTVAIFVARFLAFLLFTSVVFLPTYALFDAMENRKEADNGIFIWGDSQTFRGINLSTLAELTRRRIHSAARHGASPYDFLRFTETIPENAVAVVALSRTVQVRRKHWDQNRMGLSLSALFALYSANYQPREIARIIKTNIRPTRMFVSKTKLYTGTSTEDREKTISVFSRIYARTPDYLKDKQRLYMQGINNLLVKNVRVTFVDFPFHPELSAIEKRSPVKRLTGQFQDSVIALFPGYTRTVITLGTAAGMMHDLTHLNKRAATDVAMHIAEKMNQNRFGGLLVFNVEPESGI